MLMDLQQVGIIHNALFLSLFLDVRFSGDLWAQQKKKKQSTDGFLGRGADIRRYSRSFWGYCPGLLGLEHICWCRFASLLYNICQTSFVLPRARTHYHTYIMCSLGMCFCFDCKTDSRWWGGAFPAENCVLGTIDMIRLKIKTPMLLRLFCFSILSTISTIGPRD